MKHARLICNQKEKFQCAECRKLTSNGYQLVGEGESAFVCKDCYVNSRAQYPTKGKCVKHILPADWIFSEAYDPSVAFGEEQETVVNTPIGYIGELVPDGMGGWRVPTQEEICNMQNTDTSVSGTSVSGTTDDSLSTITVKYRFTTDNKLQVILPKKCHIDDRSYELIVTTEN